jgi:tRNA(Ile)-lysidine synthase
MGVPVIKESLPISESEFASLMEGFPPLASKIAIAVSGGPDSMALVLCVKRWAQRPFTALIVEHGLRPESAAEAETVKDNLQKMDIRSDILPWKHEPVLTRVHEKAREARYALLLEACRRVGAGDLLLAHHADDQAETILMRLAKGSGIDGLAGIPSQNTREGIRLLRPFLSLPKERLLATCDAAHVAYVADSSNASEKYARGRLRKILPLLEEEGLTVDSLLKLGARATSAKDALDSAAKEFMVLAAKTEDGGSLRLDRAALRTVPREIALRALSAGLRYVHPTSYPPEHAALSSLLDVILGAEGESTRTLYGCLASVAEKGITLLREPADIHDVLPLPSGATVLWDGRWLVTSKNQVPAATVRALGIQPHEDLDNLAPELRHKIPQGRIRAGLPAIWKEDRLLAIPSFEDESPFKMTYAKQTLF